ncbi:ATP-binding protein [Infirmifilum lucidum]|uniref:ATP-binding protein n=1 Tax=Infirmifilum lucidum TaxID=2776706 RepID=A0A7L9FIW6_9CREN|nr:ATP-binding protein [Infirmifilum lucidum]QOJ78973.1 ATP-binding protein [Infirmifilum lucidum]
MPSSFRIGEWEGRAVELAEEELLKHVVILGMTGSGKTGVGVALMEEVLMDGRNVVALDVKGDLSNIARWAEHWTQGQTAVFTPGAEPSPVNILGALSRPAQSVEECASNLAFSLLSLVRRPGRAVEHTLLSHIILEQWSRRGFVDLHELVELVVSPPFTSIGPMGLEDFAPEGLRKSLASELNAVISSPSFGKWLRGVPLDMDGISRFKAAVFYLAHLTLDEKVFFTSLLAQAVYRWMTGTGGSGRLRLLFYLDEAYGFIPPVRRTPSKEPLLLLVKQGRAFGTSVVLATQNARDIDYKALSNIGTWIIGRLQSERDRRAVAEGVGLDKPGLLRELKFREFLLVREGRVEFMRSRDTYTRLGPPLTLGEVGTLARALPPGRPLPQGHSFGSVYIPLGGYGFKPAVYISARVHAGPCTARVESFFEAGRLDFESKAAYGVPLQSVRHLIQAAEREPVPEAYEAWLRDVQAMFEKYWASRAFLVYRGFCSQPGEKPEEFEQRVLDAVAVELYRDVEKKYSRRVKALEGSIRRLEERIAREEERERTRRLEALGRLASSLLSGRGARALAHLAPLLRGGRAGELARRKSELLAQLAELRAEVEREKAEARRRVREQIVPVKPQGVSVEEVCLVWLGL